MIRKTQHHFFDVQIVCQQSFHFIISYHIRFGYLRNVHTTCYVSRIARKYGMRIPNY